MFVDGKKEQAQMLLEKLLELFSGLPDKEDEALPAEGKVDAIVVAEPKEKDEKVL